MLSNKMYVSGIDGNITSPEIDAPSLPPLKTKKGRPKAISTLIEASA
jgi:hypothetical protein